MKKILALDIKYSAMQGLYYGAYCALMAYASVFLIDKGISNSIIGIVLALVSILAIFTQPIMASYVDKNKHIELRKVIVLLLAITIVLSGIICFLQEGSLLLLCVFVGIGTCMMTITPLINSLAFLFEKHGIEINFGLARGIGSAAYALVSFVVGYIVEDFGASVLPYVYLVLNVLLVVVVYRFVIPNNERKEIVQEEMKDEKQLSLFSFCLKYKKFMIFVSGTVLVFFAHTIINNFFIQVITPIGGTESQMGTAVFLAAILELPTMALFNKMRERVNCATLIKISVVVFAIKHGLTYLAPNMTMIYLAQILQMASYAILTPASVYYATQMIMEKDLVKGQSMITMAVTASSILASLFGGVLLDAIGVHQVLLIGEIVSIIGAIIVIVSVEKKEALA